MPGPADLAAAMAQYHRDLEQYLEARAIYQAAASAYWRSIGEKRHQRFAKRAGGSQIALDDYVLTQPPVYSGPPRPRDPSKPNEPPPHPAYVPVVADFLAAAEQEFKFRPRQPRSEIEFKRAYAATALAAGLTPARRYEFTASRLLGTAPTMSKPASNTTRRRARSPRRSATTSCWRPTPWSFSPRTAVRSSRP
jgi:hypothetical protein